TPPPPPPIYTPPLHDALPISRSAQRASTPTSRAERSPTWSSSECAALRSAGRERPSALGCSRSSMCWRSRAPVGPRVAENARRRSEEHTSELQSRENLVCRLL